MKKIFNYNKFNNDVQDTIVETFVSLAQKFLEGKSETQEYRDANANLTETFMKECVEANPNMTFSGLDMLKNPMALAMFMKGDSSSIQDIMVICSSYIVLIPFQLVLLLVRLVAN